MTVVAVYSYACEAGKDTVADEIQKWAAMEDRTFSRSAFADQMKLVCAAALGLPDKWTDERKIAEIDRIKLDPQGFVSYSRRDDPRNPRSPRATSTGQPGRDFIIGLAESIRALDPEFWIRHGMPPSANIQVISDLRFIPEAEYVKDRGGLVIEIVRPGAPHKNEDRLPPALVDVVIHNDSSLNALQASVFSAMDKLFQIVPY